MLDEIKTVAEVLEQEPIVAVSPSDVRKSDLFLKQAKLTNDYKAKLEAYEAREKQAEDERNKKVLEETGNYQQLLKQKEEEINNLRVSHMRDIAKEKLNNALLAKGLNHPVAIKSAINDYDFSQGLDGIGEYVESLTQSADYSIFFGQETKGITSPASVSAAKSSTINWAQTKADLSSRDPAKRKAADLAIQDYMAKHNGELPNVFIK
jgi:peptide subunit release factor RF-3